jgi:hypothetical protein
MNITSEWIWGVNKQGQETCHPLCEQRTALDTIKVNSISTSIQVSNKVVANSERYKAIGIEVHCHGSLTPFLEECLEHLIAHRPRPRQRTKP